MWWGCFVRILTFSHSRTARRCSTRNWLSEEAEWKAPEAKLMACLQLLCTALLAGVTKPTSVVTSGGRVLARILEHTERGPRCGFLTCFRTSWAFTFRRALVGQGPCAHVATQVLNPSMATEFQHVSQIFKSCSLDPDLTLAHPVPSRPSLPWPMEASPKLGSVLTPGTFPSIMQQDEPRI